MERLTKEWLFNHICEILNEGNKTRRPQNSIDLRDRLDRVNILVLPELSFLRRYVEISTLDISRQDACSMKYYSDLSVWYASGSSDR